MKKQGNILWNTSRCYQIVLHLLGNIFASWEANFLSATMFPEVGKQGNIDRKHNVSETIFPRVIDIYQQYRSDAQANSGSSQ